MSDKKPVFCQKGLRRFKSFIFTNDQVGIFIVKEMLSHTLSSKKYLTWSFSRIDPQHFAAMEHLAEIPWATLRRAVELMFMNRPPCSTLRTTLVPVSIQGMFTVPTLVHGNTQSTHPSRAEKHDPMIQHVSAATPFYSHLCSLVIFSLHTIPTIPNVPNVPTIPALTLFPLLMFSLPIVPPL